MTLLSLTRLTLSFIVVEPVPLVEMATGAPLRFRVVAGLPELANVRFCPAAGAIVMAPPFVFSVAPKLDGLTIVSDDPVGEVSVRAALPTVVMWDAPK